MWPWPKSRHPSERRLPYCPTDRGGGGKPKDDRHPRQTRGRARSRTDADAEHAATGRGRPVDNTDPDTPPTTPDPAQQPVANVRAEPVNPEWDHDLLCELSTHKLCTTNRNLHADRDSRTCPRVVTTCASPEGRHTLLQDPTTLTCVRHSYSVLQVRIDANTSGVI